MNTCSERESLLAACFEYRQMIDAVTAIGRELGCNLGTFQERLTHIRLCALSGKELMRANDAISLEGRYQELFKAAGQVLAAYDGDGDTSVGEQYRQETALTNENQVLISQRAAKRLNQLFVTIDLVLRNATRS